MKQLIFIIGVSVLFLSCGQKTNLSNAEAEALIKKELNLPHDYDIKILSHTEKEDYFNRLQQNGLISWKYKWDDNASHSFECEIEVLDKGKPYFVDKSSKNNPYPNMDLYYFTFKGYTTELNSIDGISMNNEDKTATVRYTLKVINISPFAEALENTEFVQHSLKSPIKGEMVFKKFDTGWQIK